jgi:uncharacterized membrane protein YdbT with pleckstrin-like domain
MLRVHRHRVVIARPLVAPVLLAAGMVALVAASAGGPAAAALTIVVVPAVGAWTAAVWARWASVSFTLTDWRIRLETGIVRREVRELAVEQLAHVLTHQSLLGRLLDYGSLEVGGQGPGAPIVFADAPAPNRLREQVIAVQRWQRIFSQAQEAAEAAGIRDAVEAARRVEDYRSRT